MNGDEGFLGVKTGSLALGPPVFVDSGATVAEAARAMRAARAACCLVGTPARAAGILTERDITAAVAEGRDLDGPVSAVMTAGVVSVSGEELAAEAFLAMIRHRIRHLGVTNAHGEVTAVLEERDLMSARLESPVALAAALDKAGDAESLARAFSGLGEILPHWLAQGADVFRAGALAAAVRDQLFVRAAALALDQGPDPGPLALVVLGSEGRREQFLATDQDNALVLGPGADPEAAEAFAGRLMAILDRAGLPPCPHGVTADSPEWRMPLPEWRRRLDTLARDLGSGAVLSLSLLADARHVSGEARLTRELRETLARAVREHPRALRYMAREAVRFEEPLSMFGSLVTIRSGPGRGGLDLKRGGVFPLVQGARVLSLELGLTATDTASRLAGAASAGALSVETASDLSQALSFLLELRLRFQAEAQASGREPDSLVHPERMTGLERSRLKDCFRAVASFREILSNRYALRLLT